MYSKNHFAISVAVGIVIAMVAGVTIERAARLVAYAAFLGTAIDLDHFLIARLRAGDWSHLRFVLANPRAAVVGQDRIFETGAVGDRSRLLSHALLGGALVAVVAAASSFLALVSAVVLWVHVLCDLAVDVREHEGRAYSS